MNWNEMHAESYYECNKCTVVFPTYEHKCTNIEEVHSVLQVYVDSIKESFILNSSPSEDTPLYCEWCDKYYNYINIAMHFSLLHSKLRPWLCVYCNRTFDSASSMEDDLKMHEEQSIFKCNNCDTKFNEPYDLRVHELKHAADLSYECEKCNTAFTNSATFDQHRDCVEKCVEKETKYYRCPICGKDFFFVSNFIKHQMMCNEDRPFNCEKCMNVFFTIEDFETHLCTQHIPVRCPHCGVLFMDWIMFLQHQRVH